MRVEVTIKFAPHEKRDREGGVREPDQYPGRNPRRPTRVPQKLPREASRLGSRPRILSRFIPISTAKCRRDFPGNLAKLPTSRPSLFRDVIRASGLLARVAIPPSIPSFPGSARECYSRGSASCILEAEPPQFVAPRRDATRGKVSLCK